jgi:hypothetical protein
MENDTRAAVGASHEGTGSHHARHGQEEYLDAGWRNHRTVRTAASQAKLSGRESYTAVNKEPSAAT